MKKIFKLMVMSILMVMCTMGLASAQEKVAIFLEAPLSFCSDAKVHKMVDEKAAKIFTANKFQLVPLADALSQIQVYREEHDMSSLVSSGWSGYAIPLKKEHVQAIGRNMGADYVFFVRLTNDMPRYSSGFMSLTAKTNISCDARVMNVGQGQYTYMKIINTEGKSTAIYAGTPSFDKAYFRAFEKAFEQIQIDTSKI